MKLTYVGPFDSVIVPLPTGGQPEVARGHDIDIPDSFAERLLEQPSNWQRAGGRPKKDDITARLETLGVEIPDGAKKADLEALLEQTLADLEAAEQQGELDTSDNDANGPQAADTKESS